MSETDLIVLDDGDAAIVIDERAWPFVTGTWFGSATESVVTAYFARADAQIERAKAAGQRLAMLTDTYATKPPSATVRRRIGELSREQSARSQPHVLASCTVIENTLIRGVLTALAWFDPSMANTKVVGSFDVAVSECVEAMRAAGLTPPRVLPRRQRDPRRTSQIAS
jgi:hypothetical protein